MSTSDPEDESWVKIPTTSQALEIIQKLRVFYAENMTESCENLETLEESLEKKLPRKQQKTSDTFIVSNWYCLEVYFTCS